MYFIANTRQCKDVLVVSLHNDELVISRAMLVRELEYIPNEHTSGCKKNCRFQSVMWLSIFHGTAFNQMSLVDQVTQHDRRW